MPLIFLERKVYFCKNGVYLYQKRVHFFDKYKFFKKVGFR